MLMKKDRKKKRDKDDQIIAADGAKTMAGARAGGDQAEDPERQVAPSP